MCKLYYQTNDFVKCLVLFHDFCLPNRHQSLSIIHWSVQVIVRWILDFKCWLGFILGLSQYVIRFFGNYWLYFSSMWLSCEYIFKWHLGKMNIGFQKLSWVCHIISWYIIENTGFILAVCASCAYIFKWPFSNMFRA